MDIPVLNRVYERNATGAEPDTGTGDLTKEHLDAINEFVDIIGKHSASFNKLAQSYGAPAHGDLHDQAALALLLMQQHPDFETRFEKEVANVKGFNLGNIFKALKGVFKVIKGAVGPIFNAIKKAVQKHKAAQVAAKAPPKPPVPVNKNKGLITVLLVLGGLAIVGTIAFVLFGDTATGGKKAAA